MYVAKLPCHVFVGIGIFIMNFFEEIDEYSYLKKKKEFKQPEPVVEVSFPDSCSVRQKIHLYLKQIHHIGIQQAFLTQLEPLCRISFSQVLEGLSSSIISFVSPKVRILSKILLIIGDFISNSKTNPSIKWCQLLLSFCIKIVDYFVTVQIQHEQATHHQKSFVHTPKITQKDIDIELTDEERYTLEYCIGIGCTGISCVYASARNTHETALVSHLLVNASPKGLAANDSVGQLLRKKIKSRYLSAIMCNKLMILALEKVDRLFETLCSQHLSGEGKGRTGDPAGKRVGPSGASSLSLSVSLALFSNIASISVFLASSLVAVSMTTATIVTANIPFFSDRMPSSVRRVSGTQHHSSSPHYYDGISLISSSFSKILFLSYQLFKLSDDHRDVVRHAIVGANERLFNAVLFCGCVMGDQISTSVDIKPLIGHSPISSSSSSSSSSSPSSVSKGHSHPMMKPNIPFSLQVISLLSLLSSSLSLQLNDSMQEVQLEALRCAFRGIIPVLTCGDSEKFVTNPKPQLNYAFTHIYEHMSNTSHVMKEKMRKWSRCEEYRREKVKKMQGDNHKKKSRVHSGQSQNHAKHSTSTGPHRSSSYRLRIPRSGSGSSSTKKPGASTSSGKPVSKKASKSHPITGTSIDPM
ncbi:hypothetical protein ADUPG1_006486, partial [Aduncisulcus paluster]